MHLLALQRGVAATVLLDPGKMVILSIVQFVQYQLLSVVIIGESNNGTKIIKVNDQPSDQ
uniref:Uncharacterized protein n=1 Tax=Amphimedon queenslandica TaxID=400682 RepID=A0A1X7SSF0_AMPQE